MRNAIAQELLDGGIACRPAYMACHVHRVYASPVPAPLPETDAVLRSVIILPLYPQMTDAEQDHVIDTLSRAVTGTVVTS